MRLIENQLISQVIKEASVRGRFQAILPHLIGPAVTFGLSLVVEALSFFPWYVPSLALLFIGLAVSAVYGGLRSSLLSAVVILGYGIVEFELDIVRLIQVALAVISIAVVNGVGRQALKRWILEAEVNRRKAELVDNLNGNLQMMLRGLKVLDKLRIGWGDFTEAKRQELVEEAVGILSNLLTMTKSWREIAQTKEEAVDYLNQMANYPYRVDDAVRSIETNQREILKLIMHLARIVEEGKDNPTKTQELR
jgi:hypothetical protein